MEAQMERCKWEYEIIQAVDGQKLTEADLKFYSKKDALRCCEREMSRGEIGCALSTASFVRA